MERLRKRVWILGGVLLGWGLLIQFAPGVPRSVLRTILKTAGVKSSQTVIPVEDHNEKWMVSKTPDSVGGFQFLASSEDPDVSYKMDKGTYDTLRPWGIVARRYGIGSQVFDAVMIAGDSKDSFHDPRVCFTAQGFEILEESVAQLQTKTRGPVEVTLAKMKSDAGQSLTVFFYRGPGGFHPTTQSMKLAMFAHQFKTMENPQGVFYRFIAQYPGATKEELFSFIGDFLDAAGKKSGGFF